MDLRNAVVTGASHGIGQYIARALAGRHMNLLLVARSEAELARLARELQADGGKAAVAAVDLGDPDAARRSPRRPPPS
jgi:short-subunit dehydrogenase